MKTKKTRTSLILVLLLLSISLTSSGCIKRIALNKIAEGLTAESGTVFTGDNDPLLIGDALPFTLKTYESLLAAMPENRDMLLATGKTFCMYAYAFIQAPADTLGDDNVNEQEIEYLRSKKMYLRAWRYLIKSLDLKYPGFEQEWKEGNLDRILSETELEDIDHLYWTGMSWMGAFTSDKFDMSLAVNVPKSVLLLERVLELDEKYGNGTIHDFFISFRGGMPSSMGGNKIKAREHFKRSIELSEGRRSGPYVSLATSVSVAEQNHEEFKMLLEKALLLDPEKDPENTLVNILSQSKAKWLLKNIDSYFLIETDEEDTEFNNEEFLDD